MFKHLLFGTALALAAAAAPFNPAFAKAVPFNYPDPCKTAYANFQQANWNMSHATAEGNLGGAAGWDELADQADKSAQKQHARAGEMRQNAKDNPASADLWNKQADAADAAAKEWEDSAQRHREEAKKMRDDAKEYEEAGKTALAECMPKLIAEGPDASKTHLWQITNDQGLTRIFGDFLDGTESPESAVWYFDMMMKVYGFTPERMAAPDEPPKIEKKTATGGGHGQGEKPKHRKVVRLYSTVEIPGWPMGLGQDDGFEEIWDGPADMAEHRKHRRERRGHQLNLEEHFQDGMSEGAGKRFKKHARRRAPTGHAGNAMSDPMGEGFEKMERKSRHGSRKRLMIGGNGFNLGGVNFSF